MNPDTFVSILLLISPHERVMPDVSTCFKSKVTSVWAKTSGIELSYSS